MISEIKDILKEGKIETLEQFKPIFMGFADVTYSYCGYIRTSVYVKAKEAGELEYYKEKSNQWEVFMRGHVDLFIDMYEQDRYMSVYNNSNLEMLFNQVGTVWQNVSQLSEEANYRLDLNLLTFMNYYRDLIRVDKLNNLLKE
jgi:hypothetical protein